MQKLFIMTHNLKGGGCERVISILSSRFAQMGLDVTILTEHASPCAYALDPGVQVRALSEGERMGARDILPVYTKLRRLVKGERPDLVLALPEKVNVWTVLFLLGTGVPVVVSERNDPKRHPPSRVKRLLRRLVYPLCPGFVFQTGMQAAYFSRAIQNRGRVLDNPLETEHLPMPLPMEQRENTVVAAGRLNGQKNFPLLITAFARAAKAFPDWKLVIYGEGEEETALRSLIQTLGMEERICLPGFTRTLAEQINGAGIFVLSSDFEGLPNALMEAMALGMPVIATDCPAGGPKALIQPNENGILIPVGDADALTHALTSLMGDPARRKALGNAALLLKNRLEAGAVAEKWREYLEQIADR